MTWDCPFWLLAIPLIAATGLWMGRGMDAKGGKWPRILRFDAWSGRMIREGYPESCQRMLAFWGGLILLVISLARPQWGVIQEQAFEQAREVMISLDLSRSMLTPDVSPTRLDRARMLIRALLDELRGERVGLALFSGTAFVQCPLSSDYEVMKEMLPMLTPAYLPEGGTNYEKMLEVVRKSFEGGGDADRYLIVLSDGESLTEGWEREAEELKKTGLRVIALGVGTEEGGVVPDGEGGFVKDERGAAVLSKLEPKTLQRLVDLCGGVYQDASRWVDLADLLKKTIDAGSKGEFSEGKKVRRVERYQWFLGAGLLALFFSLWMEFPVQAGRRRKIEMALFFFFLCANGMNAGEEKKLSPADELAQMVGGLSSKKKLKPVDCKGMAETTIRYGQAMRSQGQRPAEGAIRDALEAVSRGAVLAPKEADWKSLKSQLESLLQEPPKQDAKDKKKDQKKDQDQNDKKDQQQSQQQSQEGQDSKQQDSSSGKNQESKNSQGESSEKKDAAQTKGQGEEQKKKGESGSPDEKKTPPPKSDEAGWNSKEDKKEGKEKSAPMQKVGGEKQEKKSTEKLDPALMGELQKLDLVRQRDVPANLFRAMEYGTTNAPPQPAAKGKNW